MERTGEKYTVAKRVLETRPRLMLPLPEPVTGAGACRACGGAGVDGTAVEMGEPEAGAVLVCPILCGKCRGCGRARHVGCRPQEHDDPEDFGYDPTDREDQDDEADEGDAPWCGSCRGRRSWVMQGYDDHDVYAIRVPCGCSTDLLVPAP